MKKLPLILSLIAIFIAGLVIVLEFTDKDEKDEAVVNEKTAATSNGKIAFVEVDSIIFNFQMFFDLRDELMSKQQDSEAELNAKGKEYETGARDFEEKVRKGLVTRATAAQMEQDLMQQQQNLLNLRDQLQYELAEEEAVMNRQVLEYIYDYIEEYTASNSFDYILGKSFGSPIMYGHNSLDITKEILDGVNAKYEAGQK
jgi:outer membrane protein